LWPHFGHHPGMSAENEENLKKTVVVVVDLWDEIWTHVPKNMKQEFRPLCVSSVRIYRIVALPYVFFFPLPVTAH
jgi:hypothetical protein